MSIAFKDDEELDTMAAKVMRAPRSLDEPRDELTMQALDSYLWNTRCFMYVEAEGQRTLSRVAVCRVGNDRRVGSFIMAVDDPKDALLVWCADRIKNITAWRKWKLEARFGALVIDRATASGALQTYEKRRR